MKPNCWSLFINYVSLYLVGGCAKTPRIITQDFKRHAVFNPNVLHSTVQSYNSFLVSPTERARCMIPASAWMSLNKE